MPGPQFPMPNTPIGALTMAQRKQRPLYTNPVMPGAWGQFSGTFPQPNQMGGGFDNYLGMPAAPFAFPGLQNVGAQGFGWAGGMLPPNVFNPMLLASITPTTPRSFAPSTPSPVSPVPTVPNMPTSGAPLNVYGAPSAVPSAPAPMAPAPMAPAPMAPAPMAPAPMAPAPRSANQLNVPARPATPYTPDNNPAYNTPTTTPVDNPYGNQLNVPARPATPYTPDNNPAYNTPTTNPMGNPYGDQLNIPARPATPYTPDNNPAYNTPTTNPMGNPYGASSGAPLQTRSAPAVTGIPGFKFGGFAVAPRGRK